MAKAADDLVESIKKPFKVAKEWLDKIPDQKKEYTDMHAKRVEYANKTLRDASEKKKVGGGTKQETIKTIKKAAPKKKYATKR